MKKYETIIIHVIAHPNAKTNKVEKLASGYEVWLTESPEGGKANLKIVKLLSKYLNLPKTSISMLKGTKSKNKYFRIEKNNFDNI